MTDLSPEQFEAIVNSIVSRFQLSAPTMVQEINGRPATFPYLLEDVAAREFDAIKDPRLNRAANNQQAALLVAAESRIPDYASIRESRLAAADAAKAGKGRKQPRLRS